MCYEVEKKGSTHNGYFDNFDNKFFDKFKKNKNRKQNHISNLTIIVNCVSDFI